MGWNQVHSSAGLIVELQGFIPVDTLGLDSHQLEASVAGLTTKESRTPDLVKRFFITELMQHIVVPERIWCARLYGSPAPLHMFP